MITMKRSIALLLSLILTLSLSVCAFADFSYVAELNDTAYNSIDAAVLVAEKGDTVSLLKDTQFPSTISMKDGITLDLNGHTINGSLNVEDSVVYIRDSSQLKTGSIYSSEYPALIVSGSTLTIESGSYLTDEETLVEANDSIINIYSGKYKGAFALENTALVVYSGLFTDVGILPFVHSKCSFISNDDEETNDIYPFEVKNNNTETDDISELPVIGDLLNNDDGFVCPACEIFQKFYTGKYGDAINSFGIVYTAFNAVHTIIHNLFKVVRFFTAS